MVEEVTAFRADDGSMHEDKIDAMLHDAEVKLRTQIKGDEYVNFIINNRRLIIEALRELVNEEIDAEIAAAGDEISG